MYILSNLSTVVAVLFMITIIKRYSGFKSNDKSNIFSLIVCALLSWWALCDSFFYCAPTKELAWFFHQIGALGWCGFVGSTAYYFIIMAGLDKKMSFIVKLIYWSIPTILTTYYIFNQPTALAKDLIQSSSNLGWTYISNLSDPISIIFYLYVAIYLGGSLLYLLIWQKTTNKLTQQTLAKGFVKLDTYAITVGVISLIILPIYTDYLPPLGFLSTAIFLWGYQHFLWDYDLEHIELAISPQIIFNNNIEAMFITDRFGQIVYLNNSAKQLLHIHDDHLLSFIQYFDDNDKEIITSIYNNKNAILKNESLTLNTGTTVFVNANMTKTRKGKVDLIIFSLQDISQLHNAQIKMEYLANYDELTGLANRRRFSELLGIYEQKAILNNQDFLLLFLDLNYFKSINDNFGHDAGDLALIKTSNVLTSLYDDVARLSGDEFIVLHYIKDNENVDDIITNTREKIQAIDTTSFAPNFKMDASIGVALYSKCNNTRLLMKVADRRMYQMKKAIHKK